MNRGRPSKGLGRRRRLSVGLDPVVYEALSGLAAQLGVSLSDELNRVLGLARDNKWFDNSDGAGSNRTDKSDKQVASVPDPDRLVRARAVLAGGVQNTGVVESIPDLAQVVAVLRGGLWFYVEEGNWHPGPRGPLMTERRDWRSGEYDQTIGGKVAKEALAAADAMMGAKK